MSEPLNLPIDRETSDRLGRLGQALITDRATKERFLANRAEVLAEYDLTGINLDKIDRAVIDVLADPEFERAINERDFQAVRDYLRSSLGAGTGEIVPELRGTFDFDFDFEVEAEVVAIAVAVFDFAAAPTQIPVETEIERRRQIVADAFRALSESRENPA